MFNGIPKATLTMFLVPWFKDLDEDLVSPKQKKRKISQYYYTPDLIQVANKSYHCGLNNICNLYCCF